MKFKRAVLREFQGMFVDDPSEPCVAFRSGFDDPSMSLFHQFVKKDDATGFTPEKIHVIASSTSAGRAISEFYTKYDQILKPVGETYAVAPYTMGFARIGERDRKDLDVTMRYVCDPDHFHEYVRNWLDTPEGFETMLCDISADSPEKVPVEDMKLYLKGKTEEEVNIVKYCYVNDYAYDVADKNYYVFAKKRIDEFREAVAPLTDDQLNARIEHYYGLSLDRERALREHNVTDHKNSKRLLWNLMNW